MINTLLLVLLSIGLWLSLMFIYSSCVIAKKTDSIKK